MRPPPPTGSRSASISVRCSIFFSSRRRHTRFDCDWSSDVCSSDLPHMLERGSGYVVNTASFAGLVAHNPLTIPYDTTKHGVVGLSAGLALYLRPRGIGVSLLCPGYVDTNLSENYRIRGPDEAGAGPGPEPRPGASPPGGGPERV